MNILKKHWQYFLMLALLIALLFTMNQREISKRDVQAIRQAKDSTFNVLRVYITKNKELVTQALTHEYDLKQIKDDNGLLGIENEKLKKQVGSLSNLVGFWKGKAQIEGVATVPTRDTVYLDAKGITVHGKSFEWKNNWLELDGITDDINTTINYDYKFDFKLTAYHKSNGLFKRKSLVSDVYFSDPNLKTREFTGVVIQEPKKKWYETRAAAFAFGLIGGAALVR